MKKKKAGVGIRSIAEAVGVSKTTVGYVLQNRPEVNEATRQRVLQAAARLGYTPDARVGSWMATVRNAQSKDLLPIAWLNTARHESSWREVKYLSPYLEGAQLRVQQLGYRLEEIWTNQPGLTRRRLARILDNRGIEGAIITYPARHFSLTWDRLAGVALGSGLLAPRLHHVTLDFYFNFTLALKMVKRFRYRRIGVCLNEDVDRRHVNYAIRATVHYLNSIAPKSERVPPIFFNEKEDYNARVVKWISRHKPDVIIGHNQEMIEWVNAAGYRVPEDIGVVHLATDDDVSDWAGINANKRAVGAAAAETVISLMQRRQFGIPRTAMNSTIRGSWHPGHTLLVPKPG